LCSRIGNPILWYLSSGIDIIFVVPIVDCGAWGSNLDDQIRSAQDAALCAKASPPGEKESWPPLCGGTGYLDAVESWDIP